MELLLDPMFRMPFFSGLLLAPLAALLGVYLRLRTEWLAALAYTQLAAAGGMLAVVLHLPVLAGALTAAVLTAGAKGLSGRTGNDHFALAFLLAWGVTLLLAGFSHHGSHMGTALLDGQLYFTGPAHLTAGLLLALAITLLLPWLHRPLLLGRLYPDHFDLNQQRGWHYGLMFDLLAVLTLAVCATAFGVMATFALVFIPPWLAWHLAVGWRQTLLLAMLLALGAYLAAFVLAIAVDQPFGPVLVVLLGLMAMLRLLPRRGMRRD